MSKAMIEYDKPDKDTLDAEALAIYNDARALVIDSDSMYEAAAGEASTWAGQVKSLEERRMAITRPMDAAKASVIALFSPAIQRRNEAIALVKQGMIGWNQRQEALRKAEEIAAAARAAEEKAALERAAEAAEKKGDTEAATVARETAAVVAPVAVYIPPATASGSAKRKPWVGSVTDMAAFLRYAADHPELHGGIEVAVTLLNSLAKMHQNASTIPGLKFEQKDNIAITAKR